LVIYSILLLYLKKDQPNQLKWGEAQYRAFGALPVGYSLVDWEQQIILLKTANKLVEK